MDSKVRNQMVLKNTGKKLLKCLEERKANWLGYMLKQNYWEYNKKKKKMMVIDDVKDGGLYEKICMEYREVEAQVQIICLGLLQDRRL